MDRIITNTGGQPIILADLIFLQDNIEQMGADIARLVCDGSTVLSGCEITRSGTNVSWTEGSICIEGKIYHVDAGSLTTSSSLLYWVVKYADSERRRFKNQSEHDVYRQFTCTLQVNTSGAYKYVNVNNVLPNFGKTLARRYSGATLAKTLNVTWNTSAGWSGKVYEIPVMGGKVIHIVATKSNTTSSAQIVTLPSGTIKQRVQNTFRLMTSTTVNTTSYTAYNTSNLDVIEAKSTSGSNISSSGVTAIITFHIYNLD